MKRIQKNNPDAIFTGDWHLRETPPVCRTDDFETAQWNKVDFIADLQREYDCPVIHSGDLFEHWKPSPYLLSKTIEHLPEDFNSIYGNHDLPQHNLELLRKSGLYTLIAAGKVHQLWCGLNWGENLDDFENPEKLGLPIKNSRIMILHTMTWVGKRPWPDCPAPRAERLLRKYPEFDVILTGHNHKSFVTSYQDRLLVNPGSLTRHKADQMDFEPRVYLYYADTNTVKAVFLPIGPGVVSREHLDKKQQRNNRIDAFVSSLNTDFETSVSFEDNLNKLLENNKIRQSVKDIVLKSVEIEE